MSNIMDFLAIPFGFILKLCYQFTALFGDKSGSYVIALLLFALVMQLLLSPFGIIQQRNMVKQAKMRPMEYLIRKKYAGRNDRATMQKMQQEIMELYQREGYSPLKGCLPMLLQLVIIFPLYQVVIRPLQFIGGVSKEACETLIDCFAHAGSLPEKLSTGKEVYVSDLLRGMNANEISNLIEKAHADKIITDAEKVEALGQLVIKNENTGLHELVDRLIPNATLFDSINLGEPPMAVFKNGSLWFLILIPIINLALMYVSQFVSKKLNQQQPMQEQQAGGAMGGSMKIMMWTMPLMTFFFTFMFSGAIGIYWIFRTLLSMLQQFILSRIFKMPKYTEEDLKRIEKEMKDAKRGVNKHPDIVYESGEAAPYKSLHHIDDDE